MNIYVITEPHPEAPAKPASKDGGNHRTLNHPSRLGLTASHLRMRAT